MELTGHLEVLARRTKSKIGDIIAFIEIADWPKGRLDELLELGILTRISDSIEIQCPGCIRHCPVKPIMELEDNGDEFYTVLCEIEGIIEINPDLLQQFKITDKIHSLTGKAKKRNRVISSNLTGKQKQVYQMIHISKKTILQAAYELQCTPQNISKLLNKAEQKVNLQTSRSVGKNKMQKLPEDNRGQEVI